MIHTDAKRRVAITGVGMVTSVGLDADDTWAALLRGESGAGPITQFDPSGQPVRFACEVKGFDPLQYLDRKGARRADRFLQLAIAAATQAMEQAGFGDGLAHLPPDRTGVVVGVAVGGLPLLEAQHKKLLSKGPRFVSPLLIPMFIPDMTVGLLSILYGARGPNYAAVSACASGGHSLGLAFRSIRRGETDVMIAGGTESAITPLAVAGFASMGSMSTRNDDPERACRPFDARRDGFVLGEGSGMLILEELEHARARGAEILGEIAGFGQSADAYHMTAPAPDGVGARLAMQQALEDAGLAPGDIGYINANGTATPVGDAAETQAIKEVLGDHARSIVVGATKSMTGHPLGAAGGIEAVISMLVCRHGVIPPTINFEEADPECDLDYAHAGPIERPVSAALSNSFAFGGHNACLAIRRWDDN
ncbi:beta-ketoacyl-ACP synthase II [Candidatus Palauibacter polyketidifaciens]|uniref:beta-ketoacyl-ACP synthase II n=1 Tax=Candidatus Palauibacter polyketidifaciens TaxID=3056740 RepID=UPI00238E957A|nr:beta-ketoacyl-ACP synthase II [Candidatus Palauibacter polyketidifaciens]MDE2720408.1 beta-ketoacyl-ACP synthase II [Candidatus Palauibacter polyketidifaciens]